MRRAFLLVCISLAAEAFGQSGWLPLSREVERPYATALGRPGSGVHTAIRPWRRSELRDLAGHDSLVPALVPALDRWASEARSLRWGPLVDAVFGSDAGPQGRPVHQVGAGFWADLDVNKQLSFHADAQVWDQRFAGYLDTLVRATQVAPGAGYAFPSGDGFRHYDWNAHVSWDAGRFFNFTLGRGRNAFGEGHRSLMLSDEAYSYPFFKITTSVWKVRYVNLYTRLNDIRFTNGDPRNAQGKYSSMHYLSVDLGKRANLSVFEAIVWSAGDEQYPRGFDFNYVNPVIFYRPVEFDIGSPDNALLGMGLSLKIGKGTMAYSQFVLDEFLLGQVRSGKGWYGNKQAVQLGLLSRQAFKVPGLTLRAEWNFVRPFMYTHSDTRQNYAHFGQPLAHPFGSNFQEAIVHVERDHERWHFGVRGSMAWLGTDTEDSYGNNIFRPESDRPRQENGVPINDGYRVGNAEVATLFHGQLRAGYVIDPRTATRMELSYLFRHHSQPQAGPATTNLVQLGLVCHFRERHAEQQVRYVLP